MIQKELIVLTLLISVVLVSGCVQQYDYSEIPQSENYNLPIQEKPTEKIFRQFKQLSFENFNVSTVTFLVRDICSSEDGYVINAYAFLEENVVCITTSLVYFIGDNEDELAFVIGHEIGHLVLYQNNFNYNSFCYQNEKNVCSQIDSYIHGYSVTLYNQIYELLSDTVGFDSMKVLGYDKEAGVRFLRRLSSPSYDDPALKTWTRYLSTHPIWEDRIRYAEDYISTGKSNMTALIEEYFSPYVLILTDIFKNLESANKNIISGQELLLDTINSLNSGNYENANSLCNSAREKFQSASISFDRTNKKIREFETYPIFFGKFLTIDYYARLIISAGESLINSGTKFCNVVNKINDQNSYLENYGSVISASYEYQIYVSYYSAALEALNKEASSSR
jgi:hypothetical protein